MTCKAQQHSDQMICDECGLIWDTNDSEPPTCNPTKGNKVSETIYTPLQLSRMLFKYSESWLPYFTYVIHPAGDDSPSDNALAHFAGHGLGDSFALRTELCLNACRQMSVEDLLTLGSGTLTAKIETQALTIRKLVTQITQLRAKSRISSIIATQEPVPEAPEVNVDEVAALKQEVAMLHAELRKRGGDYLGGRRR
jgi:hypothetical protein